MASPSTVLTMAAGKNKHTQERKKGILKKKSYSMEMKAAQQTKVDWDTLSNPKR